MSRSHKGSKGPGYEYWSKRPMNGMNPGAWTKQQTHKLERLEAKDVIREQSDEVFIDDHHDEIADALYCHQFGPCAICLAKEGQ